MTSVYGCTKEACRFFELEIHSQQELDGIIQEHAKTACPGKIEYAGFNGLYQVSVDHKDGSVDVQQLADREPDN